ncbi:ComF family protein [Agrilactobacillus yilanensis]|uniref:ComF family protein n=1 Tax=Agrilactobacillus yilanensis TaxID=2485997 RepID=A0ABW4J8F8_9LACO|nr:ComF family protein [Agrilactobacillus yilanensis]
MTITEIFKFEKLVANRLCNTCAAKFDPIDLKNCCPCCQKQQIGQQICLECRDWQRLYPQIQLHHQALYYYNAEMKDYFQQFKGNGDYRLRQLFQKQLFEVLNKKHYDLYILIPSQTNHLKQRGFDPVAALYVPFLSVTDLLTKQVTAKAQAQKNRQERLATPQFFEFTGQYRKIHRAQNILCLDDIYMTGRTFFHARDCLYTAGFRGNIDTFSLVRS